MVLRKNGGRDETAGGEWEMGRRGRDGVGWRAERWGENGNHTFNLPP